jgi:hypothetical protein
VLVGLVGHHPPNVRLPVSACTRRHRATPRVITPSNDHAARPRPAPEAASHRPRRHPAQRPHSHDIDVQQTVVPRLGEVLPRRPDSPVIAVRLVPARSQRLDSVIHTRIERWLPLPGHQVHRLDLRGPTAQPKRRMLNHAQPTTGSETDRVRERLRVRYLGEERPCRRSAPAPHRRVIPPSNETLHRLVLRVDPVLLPCHQDRRRASLGGAPENPRPHQLVRHSPVGSIHPRNPRRLIPRFERHAAMIARATDTPTPR